MGEAPESPGRPATVVAARPPRRRAAAGHVPCATCGTPVDPLRAERVAFVAERFRYFCSVPCRADFHLDTTTLTPLPLPRGTRSRTTPVPGRAASARSEAVDEDRVTPVLPPSRRGGPRATAQPRDESVLLADDESDPDAIHGELAPASSGEASLTAPVGNDAPPLSAPLRPSGDLTLLLLSLAALGAAASLALALAGNSGVALGARLLTVVVALGAMVAEVLLGERDRAEVHPAVLLTGPVLAVLVAVTARLLGGLDPMPVTLAATVLLGAAAGSLLTARVRQRVEAERQRITLALSAPARRVVGEHDEIVDARELRAGEEIVIDQGESVPADATVIGGEATVAPWVDAEARVRRVEGDTLVAGARVLEGRVRAVVAWAGHDRAWLRLTSDPRRRADLHSEQARFGRDLAERGALVAAAVAALAAFAMGTPLLGIAAMAVAAGSGVATAALAEVGALLVARTVQAAQRRGIVYRTAAAFDGAARSSTAVFCARGTLLLGEPEVTNVEGVGGHGVDAVWSLLAGAEAGSQQPTAVAVQRAVRQRGIRPDGVRSPTHHAGLGVTAVAGNGQPLVVGSRALMLRERVSVATVEERITELEGSGRTVLLVALGGRLVGLVALQDGLRPGARAAVQHLLDAGIEPVLLSGDTRETCEALARALDIEHVRPEVLPQDRGDEVRRLRETGATVAVVGRSPADDGALGPADVAVALSSAGSPTHEFSIQLASEDVREAARALGLAAACRGEARRAVMLAALPPLAGVIAAAFSVLPPLAIPLLGAVGAGAAVLRAGASEERLS